MEESTREKQRDIAPVDAPLNAGSISDEATLFASPLPIVGQRKTTTRIEVWSWYLYYVGNSGLAGWDPAFPRGTVPCGDGGCNLVAYGSERSAVIFLIVGSFADYGVWRPHITTAFTILTWAVSFAWLGVEQPSKWQAGTALYILGLIGYQGALTFWTAAFPGLARDLPEVKESERKLATGETDQKTHDNLDMLARNRLANVSFLVCSIGELVILAILAGILVGVINDDPNSNTKALSIVCAYSAGVWILCAIPWLWFEQYRPGNQLPPRTSYFTVGFKQIYHAFRLCFRLKQTFIYLAAYFFLGDCLNTVVIATLQNEVVSYDTKMLNYLLIDGIAAQALGIGLFWLVQRKYTIPTKTMLLFNAFWILVLCAWGYCCVSLVCHFASDDLRSRTQRQGACVNVEKSRKECRQYLEDEAMRVYGMSSAELLIVGNASEMDGARPVVVGGEKA
ncbi:hypothetical protein CI109_100712 [Kwoniella shandongensis]|uniref:Autophagy-related protein n=1 Tax=Kwoniella shandongensis TaxID=1734106 RepID=A0AAJ8MV69_9TREE